MPSSPTASDTWVVLAPPAFGQRVAELAPEARVEVTCDRQRLLDLLAASHPRVVVVLWPPADAAVIEALAAARASRPDMAAVLINAPEAVEERLLALRSGFSDALPLSLTLAEIGGRLRLLASKAGPPLELDRLPIGAGVELDVAGHRLLRDGLALPLRPREFGLLLLLARNPGRVFSRRELEAGTGSGRAHLSRSIDVHVRWLRLKVEVDPDQPRHLVTVRGAGYRLDISPDQ